MLEIEKTDVTVVKLTEMSNKANTVVVIGSETENADEVNSVPSVHVVRPGTPRLSDTELLNPACTQNVTVSTDNVEHNLAHHSWRSNVTVAVLCFINLINYMDRFTIAGVLPQVKKFYHLDNAKGGLLQTSFIISYMIMAPIFGYLGDRYSRKTIIASGVTFWSLTTLTGSFVPEQYFGIFIFLRALVGTGEASYSTIAPTIIADLFTKNKRSAFLALFYFAIPVGSGLGYIVGAEVAKLLGSWYWALRVTPGMGILSVILTLTLIREPPRGAAEEGVHIKSTGVFQDLADLSKNSSFIWSTAGFTCVTFATGALAWWAPSYMSYATQICGIGMSDEKVSLIFGVITCAAGIIGVLLGSGISQYYRKFNPRADPLVCAGGVLSSVPLLYIGCVIADKSISASWVLIFFGEVFLCMNWAIVADMLLYVVIPTRRSMAEAVQILSSHALGDACSPYLIGYISDIISHKDQSAAVQYLSLQYALYITAFVLVLGSLCFFMTAIHIVQDKTRCSLITKGTIVPSDFVCSEATVADSDERCDGATWYTDTQQLIT